MINAIFHKNRDSSLAETEKREHLNSWRNYPKGGDNAVLDLVDKYLNQENHKLFYKNEVEFIKEHAVIAGIDYSSSCI